MYAGCGCISLCLCVYLCLYVCLCLCVCERDFLFSFVGGRGGGGEVVCATLLKSSTSDYAVKNFRREVIDEDGWFHTGDIGLWLPGGRLKIIDR